MTRPNFSMVSVRVMLLALVTVCVVPMVLLAIGAASWRGDPEPLAVAMAGVVVCTVLLAWRVATYISSALEELSASVRAAGDAALELPNPHFLEELHLRQAFTYATTRLRDTDEILRRREACLRTVLDTARDAIVTADERGCIIVFNRAAEKMFGIGEHDALGTHLDRLVPPQYRSRHFGRMQSMAPGATLPRHMGPARMVWALHANGRMFPIHASISCGVEGTRRYYTSIIRELSDVPLAQDETVAAK